MNDGNTNESIISIRNFLNSSDLVGVCLVCACMCVCACVCVCVWFLDVHRGGEHMEQGQQPVFECLTDRKGKYMQGFPVLSPFSPTFYSKAGTLSRLLSRNPKGSIGIRTSVVRVLALESRCDRWEEGFSVYSSDACR